MVVRTERGEGVASDAVRGTYGVEDPARALALLAGLVLTASYVSVLHHVTTVVGRSDLLLAEVAVVLVAATVVARALRPRDAAAAGLVLLALGSVVYLESVPGGWRLVGDLGSVVGDSVALLTGLSVLQVTAADVWALAFVPAPAFLSWYLLIRQRYAAGAAVGAAALGVFVLTYDATLTTTLVGVAAAAATVGFGEVERRVGTVGQVDALVVLLALMVLVGASVQVVPAAGSGTVLPEQEAPTVEAGVVNAGDRLAVGGSLTLNPEVRFVVESSAPAYWKVGAYDRYTSRGWVRSGRSTELTGQLQSPPGDGLRINQRVTARQRSGVMPAAWRPTVVVGDGAEGARVTSLGSLRPDDDGLEPGESYRVSSVRPLADEADLRAAGTSYPVDLYERYTQLPSSTPDRVDEFTADLTEGAETPYDAAVRVERWLESNKEYSLAVARADGAVADRFLFEMDAGYCTYFATAMAVMLRTQGIPARIAVGYTTGQRVGENTWVVRAMDAHAWVEVYFPEVGWVQFDPTPSGPRSATEQQRLEQAREDGVDGVDVAGSENGTWTPTPTEGTDADAGADAGGSEATSAPTETSSELPEASIQRYQSGAVGQQRDRGLPSDGALGLGAVIVVGLAAAARRNPRLLDAYRLARVQWQRPSGHPGTDVERALSRLETVLERRYRRRRPGETRRQYLAALADRGLDDRALRVGRAYERARYGDGVDAAEAEAVVAIVDDLVREATPLVRRFR